MQTPKPERLKKIPKQLMQLLMPQKALAFCIPRKTVISAAMLLIVAELCLVVLHFFLAFPVFVMFIALVSLGLPLVFMFALYISSTIVIRKDCYECQFSFHIIAHERNHLSLNSLDEAFIEEETLKQTRDRLIPILLSNPKMRKDCFFAWRKMYSQATFDYLKEKLKEKKE